MVDVGLARVIKREEGLALAFSASFIKPIVGKGAFTYLKLCPRATDDKVVETRGTGQLSKRAPAVWRNLLRELNHECGKQVGKGDQRRSSSNIGHVL